MKTIMTEIKVILEDPIEIEEFKVFRQRKQELLLEDERWKQLRQYCKDIQYGTLNLSVKDGEPIKVTRPLQALILGVRVN